MDRGVSVEVFGKAIDVLPSNHGQFQDEMRQLQLIGGCLVLYLVLVRSSISWFHIEFCVLP